MQQLWIVIVGLVGTLVGSIVTNIISPHIKWSLEKNKEDRSHKRKLVESWQEMVQKDLNDEYDDLLLSKEYLSLRPYLLPEALLELEPEDESINHSTITLDSKKKYGLKANEELLLITEEITRIQKSWGMF